MPAFNSLSRLFGTDGIRGEFGRHPLDRPTVISLGTHLAQLLGRRRPRPLVLLGGDTRGSTPEICRWLNAGLEAGGAECRYLGVLPTPGLAFMVRRLHAETAIAVSASHNPLPDNGIKLIDAHGFKWQPEAEGELEEFLRVPMDIPPEADHLALEADEAAVADYLESLSATVGGAAAAPLRGIRIAVDSANGAASHLAGDLYRGLGAEVFEIHCEPTGENINVACGSTHPEELARLTVERGCHLGVAFDGDADRALFADETGRVRDGDVILYLWARALQAAGELDPPAIVATSMSNLGLERSLAHDGVAIERCDVGDRAVVRTMKRHGIVLGGEQSGHVIHLGLSTTGDGLLTGLQIATICQRSGESFSTLASGFRRFPQVLLNVPVSRKPDWTTLPAVVTEARAVEESLGDQGRLVLRYSGTESLARIMIEGPDQERIDTMASGIADAFRRELGD
jgi:phosphoglucosamine mutase